MKEKLNNKELKDISSGTSIVIKDINEDICPDYPTNNKGHYLNQNNKCMLSIRCLNENCSYYSEKLC